ncbi:MAG TPA: lysine-sensitive aspartokinase 3, partial [Pseudobdellovibrionaceae bacterium]|nr:lysine-sensitive aspartokinase 3 [Pseudobdellovibrionaceae bacterium]
MVSQVVSKFGGTSMGDADCMRRSAQVAARQNSRLIVVSATSGTTNDLILLGKTAQSGQWPESEALLRKIRSRHEEIARELDLRPEQAERLSGLLAETESIARGIFLLKDCSRKALDALMSLGERLSSILFTKAMEEALRGQG